MNRDKVNITVEPVGKIINEKDGPLRPLHQECGTLTDPETDEVIYRLLACAVTGTPFIVHVASETRWECSWRTLVSLAEREGFGEATLVVEDKPEED